MLPCVDDDMLACAPPGGYLPGNVGGPEAVAQVVRQWQLASSPPPAISTLDLIQVRSMDVTVHRAVLCVSLAAQQLARSPCAAAASARMLSMLDFCQTTPVLCLDYASVVSLLCLCFPPCYATVLLLLRLFPLPLCVNPRGDSSLHKQQLLVVILSCTQAARQCIAHALKWPFVSVSLLHSLARLRLLVATPSGPSTCTTWRERGQWWLQQCRRAAQQSFRYRICPTTLPLSWYSRLTHFHFKFPAVLVNHPAAILFLPYTTLYAVILSQCPLHSYSSTPYL